MHVIVTMSTEELPAADRFEWWCDQTARDVVPAVVSSPHTRDFRAGVTLADMGPVQLSVLTYPELQSVRTAALVRRSDPERYGLSLVAANDIYFAQRDRDCRLGAGDLMFHDTSHPFETRAIPGAESGRMLMLHLPKAALPLQSQRLDRLLARRLPADTGMNAILACYLTRVATAIDHGDLGALDMKRLGAVALDLAAATLATKIDAQDQLAPEARRQALLARIEAFVDHNLGDPDLSPAAIAAHHHISVAYLHRLFQPRELTVAAWIRHQRLERCRVDLADPQLRTRPVRAIAARWGFRHPADFSRAFRTAHGMPPGDYRHRALGQK
jgi:AraC-like DNA-binding protein